MKPPASFHTRVDNAERTLIICYHAHCMDGMLSAGLAKRLYEKAGSLCFMLPIAYSSTMALPFDPKRHTRLHVVFVDFCPTGEILDALVHDHQDRICEVTVIDHHVGQADKLMQALQKAQSAKSRTALQVHYDPHRSATGIARALLESSGGEGELERSVYYVAERYDLWKHDGAHCSHETCAASYFTDTSELLRPAMAQARKALDYNERLETKTALFAQHHNLMAVPSELLFARGRASADSKMEGYKKIAERAQCYECSGGRLYWVGCLGSDVNGVSALLATMDSGCVAVACYCSKGALTKVSLRGTNSKPYLLHDAAAALHPSGGGHRDSAGVNYACNPEEALEALRAILNNMVPNPPPL